MYICKPLKKIARRYQAINNSCLFFFKKQRINFLNLVTTKPNFIEIIIYEFKGKHLIS